MSLQIKGTTLQIRSIIMASLNSLVAIYGLYDVIFNVEILKNGKNMCKKLKFYLLQADWKSLRLSHFIVFLQ